MNFLPQTKAWPSVINMLTIRTLDYTAIPSGLKHVVWEWQNINPRFHVCFPPSGKTILRRKKKAHSIRFSVCFTWKSLNNQIWTPNSIFGFAPIRNPMTKLSQRLQIRSKFDRFWSIFDLFWLKYWFRDRKSQLKDQKSQFFDQESWFISKKLVYIKKVNRSILIYFNSFSIQINFFDINMVWIWIESLWRVDRTAGIGLKKSI